MRKQQLDVKPFAKKEKEEDFSKDKLTHEPAVGKCFAVVAAVYERCKTAQS